MSDGYQSFLDISLYISSILSFFYHLYTEIYIKQSIYHALAHRILEI